MNNSNSIKTKLKNKIILITGGTGSFGKEFLNYLLNKNLKEIRIFSRDELKQDEMRNYYSNVNISYYIGDVRNKSSIDYAMRNVDYVFHAAALKQVPSCEFFPNEAVLTNVIGSQNFINSCIENKVKGFVGLSTDKAVYPINVMGMTKALMEKTAISYSKKNISTKINIVRYGNVLLSRGSVVPLFVNQLKNNQELTITHEDMTRFLLPLNSAVDLVAYALLNGKQGEILVKKNISAKITDIIQALKKIYNKNNKIKKIGLRHGEKIHEVLASQDEMQKSYSNKDFLSIPCDDRDLNYKEYFMKGKQINLKKFNDYSSKNYVLSDIDELIKLLKKELIKYNLI